MGRIADAYRGPTGTGKTAAQTSETYTEMAGRNVFELLDASSNLGRSAVGFAASGGDPEYLANIAKILLPFMESRKVDIKEITGSKNPYTNLFWEIAIDPLNLVGGAGTLTKAGNIAKRLETLKNLEKTIGTVNKIEDASRLRKSIELLESEHKLLSNTGVPERAIVNIGLPFTKGIDVGDAKSITSRIPKLLPESGKIVALKEQSTKLEKALVKAKTPEKLFELQEDLKFVEAEYLKNKGVLPPTAALKASQAIQWFKKHFSTKASEPFVQTLEDSLGIQREQLRLEAIKGSKVAADELAKIGDITDKAFKERVLRTFESSVLRNPETRPDVAALLHEGEKKLNKIIDYRVTKLLKAGKDSKADEVIEKMIADVEKLKLQAVDRDLKLKKGIEYWDTAEPALQEWILKHHDSMYNLVGLENANRVKTGLLESSKGFTEYVPRVLSSTAKEFAKGKNKGKALAIKDFITPKISAAYQRSLLPELQILDANDVIKQTFNIDFDYFETDVIKAMLNRKIQSVNAITSSQFVQNIANEYKTVQRTGPSIKSFYKEFGLDTKKLPTDVYVPLHIANEAKRNHKILVETLKNPEGFLQTALQLNDMFVNNVSRVLLTVGFPEYHHRNFVSNQWLNSLGPNGMNIIKVEHVKYGAKALDLQIKRIKGTLSPEELETINELEKFKVFRGGQYEELQSYFSKGDKSNLEQWIDRPITKTYDSISKLLGASKKIRNPEMIDPLFGKAYGKLIEDNSRIAHFLHKKDKGLTSFEAMQSMNKYLFDYTDLTVFEQRFMKPTVLFYTWMRKNIPLAINSVTTNPRMYAAFNNLTGSNTEDRPDYLKSRVAFPAPWNPQLMVAGLGVPIEDLNMFNIKDADPFFVDQIKRGMQKLASTLTPTLQAPTEFLSGEKHFSRKDLRDMGFFEYLNSILPTSRAVRTAKELGVLPQPVKDLLNISEDKIQKTRTARGVELLTGIRTYTVDPRSARISESRRKILKSGKATSFNILIPKSKFKTDEEVKRLIREHRRIVEKK